MLAKSRTSAFILSLVFVGMTLLAYLLVSEFFHPSISLWFALKPWQIAVILLILLGISYGLSRSGIFMDLGEIGFGWQGLLRWFACGVLSGGLLAVYFGGILGRFPEKNFFRPGLEVFGQLGIPILLYTRIFRRRFLTNSVQLQNAGWSSSFLGWFFIIGGCIVAGAGWAVLLLVGLDTSKELLFPSATIMMGLASIIMGALVKSKLEDRLVGFLLWPAIGLIIVAMIAFVISMLLP